MDEVLLEVLEVSDFMIETENGVIHFIAEFTAGDVIIATLLFLILIFNVIKFFLVVIWGRTDD